MFQGTPVWGTQHRCLLLWLMSDNKTLLPPLKLVNAAALCSLSAFCGLGGAALLRPWGMLQGAGRGHWSPLLPFSPVCGLGVPPVPLSISSSCSSCCLVILARCRCCCSAGMDAGRDAGSRLQTGSTGRSKMHLGTCLAETPGSREERALEGMWGHKPGALELASQHPRTLHLQ